MTFLESDILRQILENQVFILQSIKPRNAKHQECIEEAEIGSGFLLTREEEEAA